MKFCLNCNKELIKLYSKGNNHKYCSITCRNKQKYLKNIEYYKKKSKEYKILNPNYNALQSRLWRINNLEKANSYEKKFRNYENVKEYNRLWRIKNKKFIKLNEQLSWKFGFKLYISQIRNNYDYYQNFYKNNK